MNRRTTTVIEQLGTTRPAPEPPLQQPNDRDESSAQAERTETLAPVQHAQMDRARADLDSGRTDTDCHGMPADPDSPCAQPADPTLLDTALAPGEPRAREAENRRTARHDPGTPAPLPDGRPAD